MVGIVFWSLVGLFGCREIFGIWGVRFKELANIKDKEVFEIDLQIEIKDANRFLLLIIRSHRIFPQKKKILLVKRGKLEMEKFSLFCFLGVTPMVQCLMHDLIENLLFPP